MELLTITENIRYTPCSSETDRPNIGYIRGTEHTVLVDSGNSPAHAAAVLAALDANGLPRPDTVFLTHHHWDHTYGLAALGGVTSIAGKGTNELLRADAAFTADREAYRRWLHTDTEKDFCKPHILLEYPDLSGIRVKPADLSFEGELRMDIGGESLRMGKITSCHTDECYYLLCEREKVLFLGDGNSEELVGVEWIDHAEKLEQQIRELETMDFTICLTGHVPPYEKEELLANLRERLARCSL